MLSDHLLKAADLALRPKLVALFEDTNKLLDKVRMELSVQEENFVRQSLATREILSPKLLIKDQKRINEKGELLTRLVIPATNICATFYKIVYLGIIRLLDKGKVNYSRVYIVQSSDLKERLEVLKIKIDEVTIASVDAINMYLSIKISTIRRVVRLFTRELISAPKKIINLCL